MASIAPETSRGDATPPGAASDRLAWAVRVALAAYLTPALAIVCAIGGAAIVLDRSARLASKLGRRGRAPRPPEIRAMYAGMKPARSRTTRRVRV